LDREFPTLAIAELADYADRSLLIVEDDKSFLERLSRAMETRGFTVTSCDSVAAGLAQIGKAAPSFAVVDLRLADGNGLDVVSALKRKRPDARAIILTSSASTRCAIATSRRRRGASTCIAAHCSGFWPSARRANLPVAL